MHDFLERCTRKKSTIWTFGDFFQKLTRKKSTIWTFSDQGEKVQIIHEKNARKSPQIWTFSDLVEKKFRLCVRNICKKVHQYGFFSVLVEQVQRMCEKYAFKSSNMDFFQILQNKSRFCVRIMRVKAQQCGLFSDLVEKVQIMCKEISTQSPKSWTLLSFLDLIVIFQKYMHKKSTICFFRGLFLRICETFNPEKWKSRHFLSWTFQIRDFLGWCLGTRGTIARYGPGNINKSVLCNQGAELVSNTLHII